MRSYDMIAILPSTEEDAEGDANAISVIDDILNRFDVKVDSEEIWGKKKLYHAIDKVEKGFFIYKKCRAKPETIRELSHDLHLESKILRFMFKRINGSTNHHTK